MQEQPANRNDKAEGAALSACKPSPFLQLAHARGHRKVRIALPAAPRHQLCPNRSIRKQLLSAELALWQASGGDYLRSSMASSFIGIFRPRQA